MKENYFENKPSEDLKVEAIKQVERQEKVLQERNDEVLMAQEVLKKELDILPLENEKDLERKVGEAVDSPSFLEKLRSKPVIRNALKTMIVVFSLMKAESAFGQRGDDEDRANLVR